MKKLINRFEFFIGSRYLRSKQKNAFVSLITLLSVVGVAVGVMTLMVVLAVMSGYEDALISRILGVESHILVVRFGEPISDHQAVANTIRQVPGVRSAGPFVYTQVMLRTGAGLSGAVLRGVDPQLESASGAAFAQWPLDRLEGTASEVGDVQIPGIVLGKELARQLDVGSGDVLFLTVAQASAQRTGLVPTMSRYRVVGLFDTGMHEFDASMAYVHLREAQRLVGMGNRVTGIEIRLTDLADTDTVAAAIDNALGFPLRVRTWKQLNANLFSMLMLQKTVLFVILTLIILVAAFNIASALIMMVSEKIRDIAILRAMGARARHIRTIFVIKGMIIGLIGIALGLGAGFAICSILEVYPFIKIPGDVYFLSTLPVKIEWLDVSGIALSALMICFLSTLYPAWHASRLDPIEGIRY